MRTQALKIMAITVSVFFIAGCTVIFQTGRRSDVQKIEELSSQLDELNQAKKLLEARLASEIADKQVKLEMMDKGLVITFVADILFDSGKANIRQQGYDALDKVARVLNENVPQLNVGIEGHTDNQPIVHSGWKSNWELSTARALSVLHYLVDKEGVRAERISAIGYGEFRPVASNDNREGRQLNRRVEIVIMPTLTRANQSQNQAEESGLKEPKENLK